MSIPAHHASKQSQIAAQKPPPPCRSMAGRVGLPPPAPQFLMPQVVGQGREDASGGEGLTRMDLLHHRVLPPARLGGRLPQFDANPVQVDEEEFSGSYFSDLMSNGFAYPPAYAVAASLPDDTPPPDDIGAQDHGAAIAKGPQRRSKNFSVDEDLLLVSAWLNVSMDAINGVDQSRSTYWKRIHDYFNENKKFTSDRSQGSLMNRWSGIQHDVNAFAGCLSKIEARNHSGWSVDDKLASACALFKEDDKTHRNFSYMHCWKVLKDKSKWMDRRKHMSTPNLGGKKQKTTDNASPSACALSLAAANVDGGQPSEIPQERPAGKKKKQRLRQHSTMEAMEFLVAKRKEADIEKDLKKEERCKKAFALQEERIRIERERVQFKRELEEERIMNIDMSTLSYKQQQYYERRQEEILAKRLNN